MDREATGIAGDARRALVRCLFQAGATLPFLRQPIERMRLIPDPTVSCLATDGVHLFYAPDGAPGEAEVGHVLAHCLFRHLVPPERAVRPLWDLACDLSAEFLRAELFSPKGSKLTQRFVTDALPENVDPRAAGAVYRSLMDLFEDELDPLYARFARDDHRYWYAPPARGLFDGARAPADAGPAAPGRGEGAGGRSFRGDGAQSYEAWIAQALDSRWPSEEALPGGASATGRYGLAPGSREEKMLLREEGKYDFSRYLRRFSTTREEIRFDLGGFDYIPYCYGLERYGNLPLIEPLEYTESRKVEELVIAIDTSGSCTRPIVERFLAEIERILMRHDDFFARMNVHIIQCDAMVQSHVAIHSFEEWKDYTKDLVIKGRSGTDFAPVFALVERLQRNGALKNLKGLLYFTDGDGAYPQKETPYETAFVFTTRRALEFNIPGWIVPLCLERPGDRDGTA